MPQIHKHDVIKNIYKNKNVYLHLKNKNSNLASKFSFANQMY